MSRKLITIAVSMLLASVSSETSADTVQGTAKGTATPQLGQPDLAPRLLQSFRLNFIGSDHHIRLIGMAPHRPDKDQATISYADHNSDDQFSYSVSFFPYSFDAYRNVARSGLCRGSCTFSIPAPPNLSRGQVFVLGGFEIQYSGGDHHIDQLEIIERMGSVTAALNDENDDDPFSVEITYAYVPRSQFSWISGMSGAVHGIVHNQIRPGSAVIRGFNFDFRSSDHHIKDLGIEMPGNGDLAVHYADQNGDDQYNYRVEYAILN